MNTLRMDQQLDKSKITALAEEQRQTHGGTDEFVYLK